MPSNRIPKLRFWPPPMVASADQDGGRLIKAGWLGREASPARRKGGFLLMSKIRSMSALGRICS